MDKTTFLRRMEAMLEIPSETLQENMKLADIPEWDSLAFLGFIALADSEMGKQLQLEEARTAQTLADLHRLLVED